jgi:hypothetical protein
LVGKRQRKTSFWGFWGDERIIYVLEEVTISEQEIEEWTDFHKLRSESSKESTMMDLQCPKSRQFFEHGNIVTCRRVRVTKIKGSSSDDWSY